MCVYIYIHIYTYIYIYIYIYSLQGSLPNRLPREEAPPRGGRRQADEDQIASRQFNK